MTSIGCQKLKYKTNLKHKDLHRIFFGAYIFAYLYTTPVVTLTLAAVCNPLS